MLRSHWLVWVIRFTTLLFSSEFQHQFYHRSIFCTCCEVEACLHSFLWDYLVFLLLFFKGHSFSIENILTFWTKTVTNGDLLLNSQSDPVISCILHSIILPSLFSLGLIFKIGRHDLYGLFLCLFVYLLVF